MLCIRTNMPLLPTKDLRWFFRGLVPSSSVQEAVEEYKAREDWEHWQWIGVHVWSSDHTAAQVGGGPGWAGMGSWGGGGGWCWVALGVECKAREGWEHWLWVGVRVWSIERTAAQVGAVGIPLPSQPLLAAGLIPSDCPHRRPLWSRRPPSPVPPPGPLQALAALSHAQVDPEQFHA